MDSPRTPQRTKRYGPSTGAAKQRGAGTHGGGTYGSGSESARRRVPVSGLGGSGGGLGFGASTLNLSQNTGMNEVLHGDDMSYDVLVDRALDAIDRAEKRGSTHVEMEEREWEALQKWQQEQLIEQEVQRRVALEREKLLEESRRRMVTVPTSSLTSSPRMAARGQSIGSSSSTPGPGFLLPGDKFTPIGSSASSSPRLGPVRTASPTKPILSRFPEGDLPEARRNRDTTPPLAPSMTGSFPLDDPVPPLLPGRSAPPALPSSSPHARSSAVSGGRVSPVRRPVPDSTGAPQPGSSYHPGKHPNLVASRSDAELVRPGSDTESSVSSYSTGSIPTGRVRRGFGPIR